MAKRARLDPARPAHPSEPERRSPRRFVKTPRAAQEASVKLVRMMVLTIAKFSLAISPVSAEVIKWSGWGEDVFSRAKAEQRFVILDLEAV
jgi:hypothetical protein